MGSIGGVKCAKYSLYTMNILVIILGCVTLGVGIWMSADVASFLGAINPSVDTNSQDIVTVRSMINSGTNRIQSVANVLVTAGVFALLVGFLGCWAAYKASRSLLIAYMVVLSLVVLLELGGGIAFAVNRPKITAELAMDFSLAMQNYDYIRTVTDGNGDIVLVTNQPVNNQTSADTALINMLQTWIGCCGGPNGYLDFQNTPYWAKSGGVPPVFCCILRNSRNLQVADNSCLASRTPSNSWMNVGCPQKLYRELSGSFPSVIGVAVGIGLFNLIGIFLAAYMYRVISRGYAEF